jgi:myo-inositol-1(or 4)-monophosphatase
MIQERHNIAIESSLKAGKDLLKYFRKEISVSKKENTGFVTAADILSSSIIFETISTAFPDDGYICEEKEVDKESKNGFVWIVDPLDGTTNFIRGNSDFSVSICLALENAPVMGIVYAPYRNELYWASVGNGAWAEYNFYNFKRKLRVTNTKELHNSVIEFPGGIEIIHRAKKEIELIRMFYPGIRLRVSESAALTLCKVAAGEVDAYIHPSEKSHDYAAGSVIVREAGGTVTNYLNGSLDIRKRGLLASNETLHQIIVSLLNGNRLGNIDYWLEEKD